MSDTPLKLIGTSGGVDKNGVLVVTFLYWVATLEEACSFNPSETGVTLPLVSRTFKQSDEGGFEVTLNYEGVTTTSTYKDDQITFELDASMAEEPIEAHPSFGKISKKYGWEEATKSFPKKAPGTVDTGRSSLTKSSTDGSKINPLYGCEAYMAVGAVFRKTYAASTIPASVLRGIGAIVSAPPNIGQFRIPTTGSNRNWLKLAPKIKRRGSAVEITEEWMLSGPAGWNKDIYNGDQLKDTTGGGDSSDGGLTTGGLTTGTL